MKFFFLRNWELKLMALVLAILLWATLRLENFPRWFAILGKP